MRERQTGLMNESEDSGLRRGLLCNVTPSYKGDVTQAIAILQSVAEYRRGHAHRPLSGPRTGTRPRTLITHAAETRGEFGAEKENQ